MKYTVNEYLDLIGSGKRKRKSPLKRMTKSHKEHMEAVMELFGMGRGEADELCSHCEELAKVSGGSFWKNLKRGLSRVGDTVKRGVNRGVDTVKRGVRDLKNMDGEDILYSLGKVATSQIPYVGSYATEGLDALQHHRKYNAKKASKNALIDVGTSFLPPGLKQVTNFGLKKATGSGMKTKRKVSAKTKKRGRMLSKLMKDAGMSFG